MDAGRITDSSSTISDSSRLASEDSLLSTGVSLTIVPSSCDNDAGSIGVELLVAGFSTGLAVNGSKGNGSIPDEFDGVDAVLMLVGAAGSDWARSCISGADGLVGVSFRAAGVASFTGMVDPEMGISSSGSISPLLGEGLTGVDTVWAA